MTVSIIAKDMNEREFVYANVTKFDYNKTQEKFIYLLMIVMKCM